MTTQQKSNVVPMGIEAVRQRQKELLEKHGWYSHIIPLDGCFNCHTHGLEQFNHLNFQLVLGVDGNTLHELISLLANRVKAGERFATGMQVDGVVNGYPVLLLEMPECRENPRRVLRVILPDSSGNFEKDLLHPLFAKQYDSL